MTHAKKVRVAIIGVGNCASSLVQGVHYYREERVTSPGGAEEAVEAEKANGYKVEPIVE